MTAYVSLSTPGVLLPDAAASFERVLKLLAKVGISSGTTSPEQATRTYTQQVSIFTDNYTTDRSQSLHRPLDIRPWLGKLWYRRKGRAAAAIPGTSNHGKGDTVDWQNLGGYGSQRWNTAAAILVENGWNNDEGWRVKESWHWSYNKADDNALEGGNTDNTVGPLEDGMKPRYGTHSDPQRLRKNRWTPIKVYPEGGVSTAFGADWFESLVVLHINAPSGSQFRARFYRVNGDTGEVTYIYEAESKVDSPVTKGNTLCFSFHGEGSLGPNERARCEIFSWVDDAVITSASFRTKEWNS